MAIKILCLHVAKDQASYRYGEKSLGRKEMQIIEFAGITEFFEELFFPGAFAEGTLQGCWPWPTW